MHLCHNRPGIAERLDHRLQIPEATAELLVSDSTRPRAFTEGDALVTTLRGINVNPGAEPEDMVAIQLWYDGTRLLTLRRRRLQSPRDVLAAIDRGNGPRDGGRLVTELIEALINRMNRSIVDMNEAIDRMEEADPEHDAEEMLARIADIPRNCLGLKRQVLPMLQSGGRLKTPFGERAFAILLFQDLSIIPLITIVAALGTRPGADEAAKPGWQLGLVTILVAQDGHRAADPRAGRPQLSIVCGANAARRPSLPIVAENGIHQSLGGICASVPPVLGG